eukprot:10999948-Lingulodinium_polyedra.AAC.1
MPRCGGAGSETCMGPAAAAGICADSRDGLVDQVGGAVRDAVEALLREILAELFGLGRQKHSQVMPRYGHSLRPRVEDLGAAHDAEVRESEWLLRAEVLRLLQLPARRLQVVQQREGGPLLHWQACLGLAQGRGRSKGLPEHQALPATL